MYDGARCATTLGVLTRCALLTTAAALLAAPTLVRAQQQAPTVEPGSRVRVTTWSEGPTTGTLARVDSTQMVLQLEDGSETTLRLDDVHRFEVSQGERSRGALIGQSAALMGLGLGAVGFLVGVAACSGDEESYACPESTLAAGALYGGILAVGGGLFGAVLGAVRPREDWHDVPLDRVRPRVAWHPDGSLAVEFSVSF